MEEFLDGEWESICKLFTVEESPHLSTDFLEYYSPTSCSSHYTIPAADDDTCHLPDILSCIDFSIITGEGDNDICSTFKRKRQEDFNYTETPNKNAKLEPKGKTDEHVTRNENSNDTINTNSDVCDASEDSNSNTLTSTGKKRASRGAATDPQSLYARKRRMRINERLKILQSLVPNGTKVDISTMLEEAFHYVKFLQLQIRMLSSDDLWMYAPLAYNGLDIGAYTRMPPFLSL